MKKLLALLLLSPLVFSVNLYAIDKFFLECTNTKADEENIQKVYFFNKIKRFTGYYPVYKEGLKVNFDDVPIDITTNYNKCRFNSDKNNEYYFKCNSEWSWNDKKDHTIAIQKQSLDLYRVMTTFRYGYQYITEMECNKGNIKDAEMYKKRFENEVKSIKEIIKKGNPKNKI
tara:strand:- start:1847 stop:2362 length:516 start_codon:yes stop_codon:yes gene_type:complete